DGLFPKLQATRGNRRRRALEQQRNSVIHGICHCYIEPAVSIKISDCQLAWSVADRDFQRSLECAITVAEINQNRVIPQRHKIQFAVAVQVGGGDESATLTRRLAGLLGEGSVSVAQQHR